jgi:hypothetical protein
VGASRKPHSAKLLPHGPLYEDSRGSSLIGKGLLRGNSCLSAIGYIPSDTRRKRAFVRPDRSGDVALARGSSPARIKLVGAKVAKTMSRGR